MKRISRIRLSLWPYRTLPGGVRIRSLIDKPFWPAATVTPTLKERLYMRKFMKGEISASQFMELMEKCRKEQKCSCSHCGGLSGIHRKWCKWNSK